eukprot:6185658-Pleurochrysis_carterae.AAC.1
MKSRSRQYAADEWNQMQRWSITAAQHRSRLSQATSSEDNDIIFDAEHGGLVTSPAAAVCRVPNTAGNDPVSEEKQRGEIEKSSPEEGIQGYNLAVGVLLP